MVQWLIIGALLAPPWAVFLTACYWIFLDTDPAVRVNYQHPKFLSRSVDNRAEAFDWEIDVVRGGTQVFAYREICVDRVPIGTVSAVWESGNFAWPAPERPIREFALGCRNESFGLVAPSSNPSRTFLYRPRWTLEQNPLTSLRVDLKPLQLRVLAPGATE